MNHPRHSVSTWNMVGRTPLIPCFLDGNATPTIPTSTARTRVYVSHINGRCSSNVYEVNTWLWQFGRGKPRMGGLTIGATIERQDAQAAARRASDKCLKETREGPKGDRA
jgi:hypothetical protein